MENKTGNNIYYRIEQQLPGQLSFFFSGALLYYYYDVFSRYLKYILFSAICCYILASYYSFFPLIPISLAVMVIYMSLIFKYLVILGKYGDFSYGVYVWHYPLLHALVVFGLFSINPYYAFIISFFIVISFAFVSWHLVEKPFLKKGSHSVVAETALKSFFYLSFFRVIYFKYL